MKLNYDVEVQARLDYLRKTGIIEGQAIDSSVNKNRWQVPEQDLIIFAQLSKMLSYGLTTGTACKDVKGVVFKN